MDSTNRNSPSEGWFSWFSTSIASSEISPTKDSTFHNDLIERNNKIMDRCIGNSFPNPETSSQSSIPTYHNDLIERNNKVMDRLIGNSLPKPETPYKNDLIEKNSNKIESFYK